MEERIGVVGLGYVGLPVALAFADRVPGTVGFDVDAERIEALGAGGDTSNEVDATRLQGTPLRLTSDPADLAGITFFVVTVPTPVDSQKEPDLSCLVAASRMVGEVMGPGAVVVYESTVYPGVTEEVCGPVLAEASGLRQGVDFKLAYSPERINPGDREHTLERVVKVVGAEDEETLERVARAYEAIVPAGVHRAPSIRVAETAKVLENTQRDINIALMNELALILDRLGIRTRDVLDAAATKWNFVPFQPGLVGGHCIGVDPYYLTAKAQAVGYHPEVILAGRRINDEMGSYVGRRVVKLLVGTGRSLEGARVGVLGLTFKANVRDIRNSGVVGIIEELREFGIEPVIHDPMADARQALDTYGLSTSPWEAMRDLEALVLAVPHSIFLERGTEELLSGLEEGGVFVDVTSAVDRATIPDHVITWSL